MLSLDLILAAAAAMALSGLPSCLLPPRSKAGQLASVFLMCGGGALGVAALVLSFQGGGARVALSLGWMLPWGSFSVALDPLSALFLALVFVVPPLGSIYGLGYWAQGGHPRSGSRLSLAYGLLAGAMVMVVVARDGVLFLIAWELMALAAYFAATASDDGRALRQAGWIYLIATHIGTLCLFAMFSLLHRATGSFSFAAAPFLSSGTAGAIFVLAIVGFGFKAGFLPLHFWLPEAHANAPSHVSAVMSGVMLKMGLYGILRMTSLMPTPPAWWGDTLLAVGAIGGIAGIVFAIGQTDIKKVLAYSSVENVGIVAMGIGLALLGLSLGRGELVLLGLGGALLHVWNHGLFKPLLFLGAGAVLHATGTRDMEKLGGLVKRMPKLTFLFLVGAVAICGLPPLNGFASEWVLYLGFFRALISPNAPGAAVAAAAGTASVAATAAVALAMIGALAVACFVRLYGGVFLGSARSETGAHARDPGLSMLLPIAILALACAFIGLFPVVVLPAIEGAVGAWSPLAASTMPGQGLAEAAPLEWISKLGLGLIAASVLIYLVMRISVRARERGSLTRNSHIKGEHTRSSHIGRESRSVVTWDCGYARPTGRMQYTASSFGDGIGSLFTSLLRPKGRKPSISGPFPAPSAFEGQLPDAVLDRLVLPAAKAIDSQLPRFRVFQRGQTHLYVLYVLVITIVLFAFGGMGVPQ
jgi:hydrogenase-4 component B